MSFIHIDYPDEVIHWFANYQEGERHRRVIGPCKHNCEHIVTSTIGWGPDKKHYELIICNADCGGNCRGWLSAPGDYSDMIAVEWMELSS